MSLTNEILSKQLFWLKILHAIHQQWNFIVWFDDRQIIDPNRYNKVISLNEKIAWTSIDSSNFKLCIGLILFDCLLLR